MSEAEALCLSPVDHKGSTSTWGAVTARFFTQNVSKVFRMSFVNHNNAGLKRRMGRRNPGWQENASEKPPLVGVAVSDSAACVRDSWSWASFLGRDGAYLLYVRFWISRGPQRFCPSVVTIHENRQLHQRPAHPVAFELLWIVTSET